MPERRILASVRWSAMGLLACGLLGLSGCDQETGIGGRRADAGSVPDIDAALPAELDAGTPPMEDDAAPPPGPRENCANSEDDTGEGYVDEGCSCPSVGEWQYCWPGDPGRRNVGACRDGVQYCAAFGEFLSWDLCNGAVLPRPEIEGNGIDEDCDGNDPGGSSCGEFEDCGPNGVDEDCDGLADCSDPDCAMEPGCASSCVPTESSCADGLDDDCDGFVDCADTSCGSAEECEPPPPPPPGCTREFPFFVEIRCTDMRDNDCDTYIDCADSDCRSPGNCGCDARETACSDGSDNDCDGDVDCADTDCQRCEPGQRRWCDDPTYCHWGIQDCNSDGSWGACIETTERPAGCSGDIYSRDCCVDAGQCCENYPTDRTSVGMCAGIVSCL